MRNIAFRKVSEPYGWLGNMAPFPVTYGGVEWRTTEALFQALRLTEGDPVRDLIREQKSPMAAKMIAKKYADKRVITPLTEQDADLMRIVLRLKVEAHSKVKADLLLTEDVCLIEDCTKRPQGTGLFWGAALKADGEWTGCNVLGVLWMELREELKSGK